MRICKIVDFAVPADHIIKLKECEKKDKYLDLAREFKKLWNMKVSIVPIVSDAFGTVTKGLLKGLEDMEFGGRVYTIQMTALLSKQKQDDQLEHTCRSYVRIRDVALKTCQKRWMIGRSGERGSGISVLAARHDDDDDDQSHKRMPQVSEKVFKTKHDWVGMVIHLE